MMVGWRWWRATTTAEHKNAQRNANPLKQNERILNDVTKVLQ